MVVFMQPRTARRRSVAGQSACPQAPARIGRSNVRSPMYCCMPFTSGFVRKIAGHHVAVVAAGPAHPWMVCSPSRRTAPDFVEHQSGTPPKMSSTRFTAFGILAPGAAHRPDHPMTVVYRPTRARTSGSAALRWQGGFYRCPAAEKIRLEASARVGVKVLGELACHLQRLDFSGVSATKLSSVRPMNRAGIAAAPIAASRFLRAWRLGRRSASACRSAARRASSQSGHGVQTSRHHVPGASRGVQAMMAQCLLHVARAIPQGRGGPDQVFNATAQGVDFADSRVQMSDPSAVTPSR